MKYFDTIYRGFQYYREQTKKDKDCINSRIEVKQSNTNLDLLTCKKLNITIQEDWIIEIEEGIRHISEAVGQERQFIRTNGDVIPIEKVKRVSKASIVHLARHSELITKMPEEGGILIPDKVYMEEKLSDYTVYENRFLYTLLIYLQKFVNMRLEKILEAINTYQGNLYLNKSFQNKTHNFSFELKFNEERFDVLNNAVDEKTFILIERLDMISREIISLLGCNLMKEVSKSPLVKPPLVKTNVLKGNKNFKAAVVLYDFINVFESDGYLIEELEEKIDFNNEISDEYAELVSMTSLLTYKFGNHLSNSLKNEFDRYQEELKIKEHELLLERIKKIKTKVEELGMSLEEYVMILEKRNTELEEENLQIVVYKEEIDGLKSELISVKEELEQNINNVSSLSKVIEEKNKEITILNQKIEEQNSEKNEIIIEYEKKLNNVREEVKEELELSFSTKTKILEEEFNDRKIELKKEHDQNILDMDEAVEKARKELQDTIDLLDKTKKEKSFIYAQLLAMRIQNNVTSKEDDYTSKERFKELEEQYFIFEQFFSEEWKKTKKKIRKQYLSK